MIAKHVDINNREHKEISMEKVHEEEEYIYRQARIKKELETAKIDSYYDGFIKGVSEVMNLLNHSNLDFKEIK